MGVGLGCLGYQDKTAYLPCFVMDLLQFPDFGLRASGFELGRVRFALGFYKLFRPCDMYRTFNQIRSMQCK